jgi:putative transposase
MLFSSAADRASLVRYMVTASCAEECPVSAAALMSNHVHLVTTPRSADALSRWVKSFAQRYAIARNRARDASGKLFEQRFDAKPILSERQLAATIAYVDANPARAGVGPRSAMWSTLALHRGTAGAHPLRVLWTPSSWWLSLGADDTTRGSVYADFLDRRFDEWAGDVVRVRPPSPVAYTRRLLRPDGRRVAESMDGDGASLYGQRCRANAFGYLRDEE